MGTDLVGAAGDQADLAQCKGPGRAQHIHIRDDLFAVFVLFVLVLQQVDGNIIGPKILGNTTGLSSFWVLFAILLFGGLWGFVGMIIGVPLFAVIYDVIKKLVFHGLNRNDESGMVNLYHDAFGDPDDE